ncbi:hypothetical protein EX30DRAFT_371686 [Ascodesmis nigricans]|uniref:Uncharacterized protein n=1 Tax=Ascodesmis nigricans TaxID=341454 RepID=A0A4S2MWM4_9PEZI|nr:hypothetical protein EX30DRAFT_371686 [Ascodesmis nigricans]
MAPPHFPRSLPSASPTTRNLLITLITLLSLGLLLGLTLLYLRRVRASRKSAGLLSQQPPPYSSHPSTSPHHNRGPTLSITTRSSQYYSEKQGLIGSSSPMAHSPDSVPEIRITFPEEEDEMGRRRSGRVVVVEVGEAGVGWVRDLEQGDGGRGLPRYEEQGGMERVDIEKVGGLKEKELR